MIFSIDDLVSELPRLRSTGPFWDTVHERLNAGDMAWAAELGVALLSAGRGGASQTSGRLDAAANLISDLSQSAAQGALPVALRVAATQAALHPGYEPATASALASSPQAPYIEIAYDPASEFELPGELKACLTGEMVLREYQLRASDTITAWLDSPAWTTHPLAWLPLQVTDVEAERHLPNYHGHGSSQDLPDGQDVKDATSDYATFTGTLPTASNTTTPDTAHRIAAAVQNWADHSNGIIDTGSFHLSGSISLERLPNLLTSLGLESLASPDGQPPITISETTFDRVWEILFSDASSGCSYSRGLQGTYGRLATWQAIAALISSSPETAFDDVSQRAEQTRWALFAADTDWFYNFIHDIGIISIDSTRRFPVVVATGFDFGLVGSGVWGLGWVVRIGCCRWMIVVRFCGCGRRVCRRWRSRVGWGVSAVWCGWCWLRLVG